MPKRVQRQQQAIVMIDDHGNMVIMPQVGVPVYDPSRYYPSPVYNPPPVYEPREFLPQPARRREGETAHAVGVGGLKVIAAIIAVLVIAALFRHSLSGGTGDGSDVTGSINAPTKTGDINSGHGGIKPPPPSNGGDNSNGGNGSGGSNNGGGAASNAAPSTTTNNYYYQQPQQQARTYYPPPPPPIYYAPQPQPFPFPQFFPMHHHR